MSGDNIFCLALILVFIGLIVFENIVKKGWLIRGISKKLAAAAPEKRQHMLNRWSTMMLLTRLQVEELESKFISPIHPEPDPNGFDTVPLSKRDMDQASGQAVITASLPLAKRMHKINELHLKIIMLTSEVNLYRKAAGKPRHKVEL